MSSSAETHYPQVTHHCTTAKGICRGQEYTSVIGCVEKYLDKENKESALSYK